MGIIDLHQDYLQLVGNSNQTIRLFENLANEYDDRHWISFDLIGSTSNKQAIGAEITLWVNDDQFQVQQKFGCSGSFGFLVFG